MKLALLPEDINLEKKESHHKIKLIVSKYHKIKLERRERYIQKKNVHIIYDFYLTKHYGKYQRSYLALY